MAETLAGPFAARTSTESQSGFETPPVQDARFQTASIWLRISPVSTRDDSGSRGRRRENLGDLIKNRHWLWSL